MEQRELEALLPGVVLLPASATTAREAVRLVEDTPSRLTLEHVLLIGEPAVAARRWRQTWLLEPTSALGYTWTADDTTMGTFGLGPVDRTGGASALWFMRIADADDRPVLDRVGRWGHSPVWSRFEQLGPSDEPLPRGSAQRSEAAYLVGASRLTTTPQGWSLAQPGVLRDEAGRAVVTLELRSLYRRVGERDVVAERYGVDHDAFWSRVRSCWDRRLAGASAFTLRAADERGRPLWHAMLALASSASASSEAQIDAVLDGFIVRER